MLEFNSESKTYAVIRAVYEHRDSPEDFEKELDFVLSKEVSLVVIEPEELGEDTWRWITTGNVLHKISVVSGLSAVFLTILTYKTLRGAKIFKDQQMFSIIPLFVRSPRAIWFGASMFLSTVSISCATLYDILWQFDPCAKYQIVQSINQLPSCLKSSNTYKTLESGISSANSSLIAGSIIHPSQETKGPPLKPVVIIRKDDSTRKILHNSVAALAAALSGLVILRFTRTV